MELHSYAKRKVPKKWTIEQKRKLVEARIRHDEIFTNKPTNSVLPWKIVLNIAKLDDYNVYFVRKQWANMVAKYKQYKQNRSWIVLDQAIDEETVQNLTQEWEFFQPIHRFMTRKTTNLHSYALTRPSSDSALQEEEQQQQYLEQQVEYDGEVIRNSSYILNEEESYQYTQPNSASSNECINVFSSDTNEDFVQININKKMHNQNTDHDFYTKKMDMKLNYFADVSEDSQENTAMVLETTLTPHTTAPAPTPLQNMDEDVLEVKPEVSMFEEKQEQHHEFVPFETTQQIKVETIDVASTSNVQQQIPQNRTHKALPRANKSVLSERDKYYRHKRRFNRRLERRFDCVLNIMGQIVKAEYPSIDVSSLQGGIIGATATTLTSKLFSSDDDDDNSAEEMTTDDTAEIQETTQAK